MSLDLGLHLGRLIRRPLARWLEVPPTDITDDLRATPADWSDVNGSHWLRFMIWGVSAGCWFVLGIAAATVEQAVWAHADQPSGALQVLFGTCLVTAYLHGGAALVSHRRVHSRDAPAGLAKLLLWPGNRYFVVTAAFFAVAVITTTVPP